ncbi:MAG: hypothetical protein E6767_02910 [Dysgonomonas sp.]|nr:hypothetical protein [Dysgonomonas sp.]
MINSNPYSWLSDYLNIEECKENILYGFRSCYMQRVRLVRHIGFEKEEVSEANLTFYFKTKNAPYEDFFSPKWGLLSETSITPMSNLSGIDPEGSASYKQRYKILKNALPVKVQRLSEYKPSFRTNVLCYDEDNIDYKPIFKHEIEKRIEQASNAFYINALNIDDRRGYIDFITDFLLKGYKTIVENASDYQGAYNVVNGIVTSQYRTALNYIHKNYFSDLSDTKLSQLNKIFTLKEGTKSFHSKIQINHSDMERAVKKLKDAHLVDRDTPVQAFINLFKNVNMSNNKINWTGGKMALCDFIKLIMESKYILNSKNEHWAITANSFTINGAHMERKTFLNSKPIKDDSKIESMNNFLITIGLRMPKKK